VIERAMDAHSGGPVDSLDAVRGVDAWARQYARATIESEVLL
jgi:hypothetical protein